MELLNYIDGDWVNGEGIPAVNTNPFTNEVIDDYRTASHDQVVHALARLQEHHRGISLSQYERAGILHSTADIVQSRFQDFAEAIVSETGFTMADASMEIARCIETLRLCAEEARRLTGQTVPLDGGSSGSGRIGFTLRKPVGVVCAITPFNSPLNTVAHKLGPAIAAGNAVILKPSDQTPRTSALFVDVLLTAGFPSTLIGLVQGDGSHVGRWLITSPVPSFYAFTGSTEVGREIHETIGIRRSQLELGSIASTIVCADGDLERAAQLCVRSAFRKAGQVCTSIQRLYVDAHVMEEFCERLLHHLHGKSAGDPSDPETFIGPLITRKEAERVERWVSEATSKGAQVLTGGERDKALIQPTVLMNVSSEMRVMRDEVFGPVVCLRPFDSFRDALAEVNDTPYGLAAGIFTENLRTALQAARELDMGSVHVNETSSSRVDLMPYTGTKESGLGTEGPAYAIKEMTQECLVTFRFK